MSKCDDWQDWDKLSPEEKEQFLADLVTETANDFGIPAPNVEFGDLNGPLGQYNDQSNTVTIDPAAAGSSGYAQFDDASEVADTAFHEVGHAAQAHYYDYYDDAYGISDEGQQEAEDVAREQRDALEEECDHPPYPGDGSNDNEASDPEIGGASLPVTVDGWDEAIAEQEEFNRAIDELPLEPIPQMWRPKEYGTI